jgi:peroxiredoxin
MNGENQSRVDNLLDKALAGPVPAEVEQRLREQLADFRAGLMRKSGPAVRPKNRLKLVVVSGMGIAAALVLLGIVQRTFAPQRKSGGIDFDQVSMPGAYFTSIALGDEPVHSSDRWQIRGRVVDQQGKPVEDFVAATFWSANGKQWDDQGREHSLRGHEQIAAFWQNEGMMAPFPEDTAKRLDGGVFLVSAEDRPRVSVFATDKEQKRGGYVTVEKIDGDKPVTITLVPLVRVTGKVYCPQAGRTPDWTAAVPHPVGDRENCLHFTHCGSVKGEFSFLLPPGKYDLAIYSQGPDARMPRPEEREKHDAPADMPEWLGGIRVEVPRDKPTLDLGVLNVVIPEGRGDYSAYYGKEPPALEITDARGISKEVKLSDLRGKWVLLDFWSLRSGHCLQDNLPELRKFYEKHAADRQRFEILSICDSIEDNIKTVAEFEKAEKPIVGSEWHGKELPFPVLIDGEGKTRKAYGLSYVPQMFLIDPEGHLVKWGDEVMLEEKLSEKPQ